MRFQDQSTPSSPRTDFTKAVLVVLAILIMSVAYVWVFSLLGQLLNYSFFWILSLVLGLLSGGALGYYFAKGEFELFEQVRLYVIFGVTGIVVMPLIVFVLNRYLTFSEPQMKAAQLELLKPNYGQPFGYVKGEEVEVKSYKLILNLEGRLFEFFVDENPYPDKKTGSQVLVPVYSGALGISYIHFKSQH